MSIGIFTWSGPPSFAAALSLAQVRQHVRLEADETDFDASLALYGAAAQSQVEAYLGYGLAMRAGAVSFPWTDAGPRLRVSGPPNLAIIGLSARVAGVLSPLDPALYVVRPAPGSGAVDLAPAYGARWPVADRDAEAWRVDVTAGYAGPDDIPPAIIAGMLLVAGDLFTNRDAKTSSQLIENPAVAALLAPFRLWPC